MKTYRSLKSLADLSCNPPQSNVEEIIPETPCEFKLSIDDETFQVYAAYVGYGELTLLSEQATLTYAVDYKRSLTSSGWEVMSYELIEVDYE